MIKETSNLSKAHVKRDRIGAATWENFTNPKTSPWGGPRVSEDFVILVQARVAPF